jgi:hypothetical protein
MNPTAISRTSVVLAIVDPADTAVPRKGVDRGEVDAMLA